MSATTSSSSTPRRSTARSPSRSRPTGSPACSQRRASILETEFATGQVDGESGRLVSWDEREIPFDLLVTIPLHGGAAFVARSPGLGDELGFVTTDNATLQSKRRPERVRDR